MTRLALIVPVALAVAACGGSDGSAEVAPSFDFAETTVVALTTDPPATDAPADPPATVPAPATDAATRTEPPATEPPTTVTQDEPVIGAELVGRWAHYDVVAYEDGTLKTLIISYGFNDFELVDGQIIDSASFCFSEQRTDQAIETSLSDAATQAIKPPSTPIDVTSESGILRISRDATPTPVGIRLDDPFNTPLPTDPTDPRIVDDDGDGNPGITVTIRVGADLTGELYIARREIFAYEAELTDADTLVGQVTDSSEQLVIGASDPIFDVGTNWEQFPDLTKSPIILKRVAADWDCSRLAAERDALFPPTPDVDW